MTIHLSPTRRRSCVAVLIALTLTAGCGSPGGADKESPSTSDAPTAEAASAAAEPVPVEGTWSTTGITRADFNRSLARHGLGDHARAFAAKAGLGRSADLTLEVSERFWTLYVGMDGAAGALTDRGTYELRGDRVVVQPNSGGKNVFRWTVTGDELALALVSTTEPPYEGVPAEVFQSGYYATSAFAREAS